MSRTYASAFLNSASFRSHPRSAAAGLWFCESGGIQPWFAPLYTSISADTFASSKALRRMSFELGSF